ncbi:hypothetical protein [uncultured Arcticibacterium sp.]|uniref:hypothetical protein n=1 Tax=uncultured Arcticibacterium sp. TaxID=2173042 RepID=UPI0030FACCE5
MKKTIIKITFLLLFSHQIFSQYNKNITAETIVNNSIIAIGGKEYLKSIKTLYTDIKTEMEGRDVNWVTKEMLPNKGSFEVVYKDRIVYQNWFDGISGYEIVNGEKKEAAHDEFKDKIFKNNIFNELDYLDPQLWTLDLIGKVKVGTKTCYKIKAELINGLVKFVYFDIKTFYIIKTEKVLNLEKDSFMVLLYSKFKKFENLTSATEIKFGDGKNFQKGKIMRLLINENITESDFN